MEERKKVIEEKSGEKATPQRKNAKNNYKPDTEIIVNKSVSPYSLSTL